MDGYKQDAMTREDLQTALAERGMTQVHFARVMHCTQPAVSQWLAGDRRIPEQRVRAALAEWDRNDGEEVLRMMDIERRLVDAGIPALNDGDAIYLLKLLHDELARRGHRPQ